MTRPHTKLRVRGPGVCRPAWLWALLGTLLLPGCLYDVWSWEQCDIDPSACAYDDNLTTQSACALKGEPLRVHIGWGEATYAPVEASGHAFKVYYGPQGGSHVYAALRLENPSPEFDRLSAEFEILDDDACVDGWRGDRQGCPPRQVGYRKTILRGKQLQSSGDAIEAAGVTVYHLFWGGDGGDRMTLTVLDACGRVGEDTAVMLP